MAQLWPLLAGLIVLLGTNINLAGAGTCKPATCSPSGGSGLFKYTAGNTYIYHLEGNTVIDLPAQNDEPIKVGLKAVAEVNFGAACTNTLKLRDVQVTGPNSKVYGDLKDLETYPVQFSFHDGVVEPEICADADDSNTGLNIKRAVISLLQVSVAKTSTKFEVDVFGSCSTNFKIEAKGGETVVHKSRDLSKCAYREDLRNRVATSTYITNSDLQSTPILDSNLVVELVVKDGVVKKAESHEIYLYRPFANQDAGAKTVIHTSLTFVSNAAGPAHQCKANAPRSLIFDSPHSDSNTKSSVATITAAMKACKTSSSDSVNFASATEFRHLVEVFRSSKKDDLLAVFKQVKAGTGFPDKESAKKLFLDALFRSGNGDSIQAAVELLKTKEFSDGVARLWYMSFAFARHVTPAALVSASSLLEATAPKEAYLGIGSLAARYCNEHICDGLHEYDELIAKMSQPLAKGCKCSSFEQENQVIAALKGLENMRGVNSATAVHIATCMSSKDVPARVRVAALETARSASCQPELKKTAHELLANTQEDSEIRIKAYLTIVECPCGKCANTIKGILDSEPVNQVGSFIVSHLRNIKASTNPEKAAQKQHLGQISTTKKFPFDFRKFSRNYEFSGLLDAINVGSSAEANVIYSQQSYLPRSTSFNLTAEVFGHSINLLEVGTRAQNLDRLVESLFGPKGYFTTHDVSEIFTNGKLKLKALKEKLSARFSKTLRSKRSVPTSALEAFRKTVHQPTEGRDMNLDLNVKMFGTTLVHKSYHGNGHEFSYDHVIDKFFDCLDKGLNGAKSFNHDLKHHAMFYENEIVYPTGLGFPLKMIVTGTAAVSVKLDGKVDIHTILKDPKNAHFQFEVVPSAAVEVVGMMSIDAYAVETGLKISSNLHTSTGVNVNVKSMDGLGMDLLIGLPVKKQEIINVQSTIMSSVQERGSVPEEKAMTFNTKRKDFHGCFDQLSSYTGLTFCSDIGIPLEGQKDLAALFPLNGPSKFSLTVESEDVESYKLKAALNLKDDDRKAIEFLIDTPKSKQNRKVELVLEAIRKPNLEMRVKFSCPVKVLSAELVYVNTPIESSLLAKIIEDSNEHYLKLGADIAGKDNHKTYTPSIEYFSGNPKDKLVAKGKGKGKTQGQAVRIEGSVAVDKEASSTKLTFKDIKIALPIGTIGVDGSVEHDKSSISSDLKLVHNTNSEFKVKGKVEIIGPRHFKVKGTLQATQYPDLSGSLDWVYNRQDKQLDTKLILVHGKDLSSKDACVTAEISAKYQGTGVKDVNFVGLGKLSYPLMGIAASINGDLKPHGFSYGINGAYEKYKAMSGGHFKVGVIKAGDYDVEFEAKVLENHIKFESKRDVLSPIDSKFVTKLEMTPGGKHELTADVGCKMEKGHILTKIVAVLTTNGKPEPYHLDTGIEITPAQYDGHFKATQGKSVYADVISKLNRGPKPNGNFKVLVLEQLDAALDFSLDPKSKGSLQGHIKLLKLKRMLTTTGTLTITGSSHAGNLDVVFDESDPKKKIHFETISDVKAQSIDSKNTLVFFGYKTVFNTKGELKGPLKNGHLEGSADVTLPNNVLLTGSIDQVLHMKPSDIAGTWKIEASVADKQGAPARSLTVNAKADKCDQTKGFFDIDFSSVYKDRQGKDFKYQFVGKHLPNGEKRHVEILNSIQGSLLNMAPMTHIKVDIAKPVVNYAVKIHLTDDSNLDLNGKAQSGISGTVPYMVENTVELNLPTGELKHIKASESWTFVKGVKGGPCELKGTVSATYNGANTVKLDADIKANTESGEGKVTLAIPNDELRVIKATYNVAKGPGIDRDVSLTSIYGKKEGHVHMKIKIPEDRQSFHITLTGDSPWENYKTFGLVADSARKAKSMEAEASFTINDKKAVLTSKYGLDWKAPIVEMAIVHPSGKTAFGFHFLPKAGSANHYESELTYEHNGEAGHTKADVLFPSVNDFTITLDSDVPRLKINKVHLVITNQPGVKGGKSITIVGTEESQPTINGKLDFTFKDGSDGALFEASGNVKVRGENRQAKIVVKKNVLSSAAETGIEYTLTTVLGEQTIDSFFKYSTKEIHLKLAGCQKKGACGKAEFQSKLHIEKLDFSNEVVANLDVTELGLPTNVGFKRITQKKGADFLHQIDFTSKGEKLMTFKIAFSDKASSISLITPAREMAVEAHYGLTSDPKNPKHHTYSYETSMWLNKAKDPASKATGSVEMDYLRTDDSITVSSEAKFTHPSLGKDMLIKGSATVGGRQALDTRIEIDVFAKKGQRITIDGKVGKLQIANGYNFTSTWDIKSKGNNLDLSAEGHAALSTNLIGFGSVLVYKDDKGKKDIGVGFEGGLYKTYFFIKSPREILIEFNSERNWNGGLPSAEFFLAVAGNKGIVGKISIEEGSRLVSYIHYKDTPARKIQGESVIDFITKMYTRLDWYTPEKKELYSLGFDLDEKITPDISISFDNFKTLVQFFRTELMALVDKSKAVSKGIEAEAKTEFNELADSLKKSQPNLKPLIAFYQAEIKAIRSEIASHQSGKELSHLVKQYSGQVTEIFGDITEVVAKIADRAITIFEEFSNAIIGSIRRIMPKVAESYNRIFIASAEIFSVLANEALDGLQKVIELCKKHEPEIKAILADLASVGHTVYSAIGKSMSHVCQEIKDFVSVISDQVKALPIFSMMQERYQEVKLQMQDLFPSDTILRVLNELTNGLKDLLPTPEMREFVQFIANYLEKLLKHEKVDHAAETKKMYQKGIAGYKSVALLVLSEKTKKQTGTLNVISSAWHVSLRSVFKLPRWASMHLSPLHYMSLDDLPSLHDYLVTYTPRSAHPDDMLPPFNSYGLIMDTAHFFTFDKRHFTFQGTCSYLLAQDITNGNFSLILNLDKGKFKSIELNDGHDSLEVTVEKTLLLNGKPSEFPFHSDSMAAWHQYHSVNLKAKAGLKVGINQEYGITMVGLDGFYHGQVRGLLGDSNYEEFDDFRLPSGKITTDAAEFGNAYVVGGKCAPGTSKDTHTHQHEEVCTNIFSANSPLRLAFMFVDPEPFRKACDHFVSETTSKKQEYACRIAAAYVQFAAKSSFSVSLPHVCATCEAPSKRLAIDEIISIKTPSQKADIVIILEQVTSNAEVYKDLVSPLVDSLTAELKLKGINDVVFSLIGFGHPKQDWPAHHTTKGQLVFDGKAKLEFGDAEKFPTTWGKTNEEKWDFFKRKLHIELGKTKLSKAIAEAAQYPFRAGASKTVLLVVGSRCEKSFNIGFQKMRMMLIEKIAQDRGLPIHVITPMEGFNIMGSKDAKAQKSVVGFDADLVYSFQDGKKKNLEGAGNEDLRKDIEYSEDTCIEISQMTNGAVFNANNFIDGKANQRKQFLQVLVSKMAEGLSTEVIEECRCTLHNGLFPESRCKVADRKVSEQLKAQTDTKTTKKGKKPKN